jgi:hypothetical protein
MPLSLRAPRTRSVLAVYTLAFTAYAASWVAVVWAPTSAWSTSAVGFTALAWTSILLFTGIGPPHYDLDTGPGNPFQAGVSAGSTAVGCSAVRGERTPTISR